MSGKDVEVVDIAAPPAYEANKEERTQDKILEGGAILGGIERVQEYGYVERG